MKTISLSANARQGTGKGPNRRLRRDSQIPAVLYGQGADPILLSFGAREFQHAVSKLGDEMVMFKINATGVDVTDQLAVIREAQRDPLTDRVTHIDMMRIDVKKPIDVEVAVHGVGAAPGVRDGGVLEQVLRTVHLRCLPTLVPSHIDADVSNLLVNQALHVSDLQIGEGIEVLSPAHDVVLHVVPPRKMDEVAAEAAPVEGEAGAEPEVIGKKDAKDGKEAKEG
jgi:large subunit ribosomal protein L25